MNSVCKECPLYKVTQRGLSGEGNKRAIVCFIGKHPGKKDKRVFEGPSGLILGKGLVYAQLLRKNCFVTNLVKCSCINRNHYSKACTLCKHYLFKELEVLTELRYIVALGNEVTRFFCKEASVETLHGTSTFLQLPHKKVRLFLTYSPGAALRAQTYQKRFLNDMTLLGEEILNDA